MNIEDYKYCPKCDNVFPTDTGFYPNAGRNDGLGVYCQKCQNEYKHTGEPLIVRNNIYEVKKCSGCKLVFDKSHFGNAPTNVNGLNHVCKDCKYKYNREYEDKLRFAFYEKHGNKCAKCGYSENRDAFQIDHVNNDGAIERANINYKQILKNALADTEGRYQLLCAICNHIKRVELSRISRKTIEPYAEGSPEYVYACAPKYHTDLVPHPEPITGALREAVMAAKAFDGGRFQKGQKPSNAALPQESIQIILNRLSAGEKGSVLAKEYGVSQTAISRIKLGKTYTQSTT